VEKIVNHREYGFAKNIRQYAKAFWSKCQISTLNGSGSVCHSRESGSTTRLVENSNIFFCSTMDAHWSLSRA
jgi:hypothetical protein